MNPTKSIKISCEGTGAVPLSSLVEFQGKLKSLPKKAEDKLRKSIIENGFRIPVFTWRKRLMDGHQRVTVLKKLSAEGYEIPPIPTVELKAEDEQGAKKLLLLINSRYGQMTQDGLFQFGSDILDSLQDTVNFDFPEITDVNIDSGNKLNKQEINLKVYKKTHILLSFHPSLINKIKEHITEIIKIEGVEYEQSSN